MTISNRHPWKDTVKAASTGNLVLSGTQTVDGIALVAGDRVLAKDQTAPAENGIYNVRSGAWIRDVDANANNEVIPGSIAYVQQGTVNEKMSFTLTTPDPIVLGTTALTFEDLDSAGGGGFANPATTDLDMNGYDIDDVVNVTASGDLTLDSNGGTGTVNILGNAAVNTDGTLDGTAPISVTNTGDPYSGVDIYPGFIAIGDGTTDYPNFQHSIIGTSADLALVADLGNIQLNPVPVTGSVNVVASGGKDSVAIGGAGGSDTGITFEGDTNLYRSAANVLFTDDSLTTAGSLTSGLTFFPLANISCAENTQISHSANASHINWITAKHPADAQDRFLVSNEGRLTWSSGSAAVDTSLYRSAADTLKTDDSLIVDINLTVNGNTVLGSATTDTVGLYGDAGAAQAASIADASGGAIIDAEARTAINALLAAVRTSTGVALIAG